MDNAFIATTSTEGLKPLGTAPQRSYELLVNSLTSEQAAVFAEPVYTDYGDKVDWYSAHPGKVQPLSSLAEDKQLALRDQLNRIVDEIRAKADALLEDEEDSEKQRLGEALQHALEIPSEDSIYARVTSEGAIEPVLLNWAWVEDHQQAVRGVLSGSDTRVSAVQATGDGAAVASAVSGTDAGDQVAARRAEPAAGAGAAASPLLFWWLFWLGWLLLALMIGAILLLLIAPCAVRLPGLPTYCLGAPAQSSPEQRYTMILRDQVAILERQIAIADRACQPEPGIPDFLPPPVLEAPPPDPLTELSEEEAVIGDRLTRAGAEIGQLTFSLVWDGPDDLDLEVTCPTGERLFWGARSACGGSLDIDTGVGSAALEPVENIYFDQPPPGEYGVRITMPTSRRNGAAQPFQLLVRDRAGAQLVDGVVSGRDREWNYTHQLEPN